MKKKKTDKGKKAIPIEGILLTGIVCILVPLMYFRSALDPVLYPRLAAWSGSTAILALAGYAMYRNKRVPFDLKHPVLWFLAGFVVWSFLALIWAGNPVEGLTDVFKWGTFFLFTILSYQILARHSGTFDLLVKGVVLYALFTSLFGFMQFLEFVPMQADVNAVYEVKGFMAHKNQLSIAMFLFLPFLFYGWSSFAGGWKNAALVALVSDFLLILILGTRAVWLALIFTSLCFVLFYAYIHSRPGRMIPFRKWMFRLTGSAVLVILLLFLGYWVFPEDSLFDRFTGRLISVLDPEFTSNKWRTEMWQATFQLFLDHPLLGVGPGNWKIEVYPYYSEFQPSVFRHWRNPHNDYLLAATEKGIIGLLLFVSVYLVPVFYFLKYPLQSKSQTGNWVLLLIPAFILGYMFASFFSFPGERIHHHVYLGILLAFAMSLHTNKEAGEKQSVAGNWLFLLPLVFLLPVFLFSLRTVKTEINVKKAFAAQESEKWNDVIRSIERAQFRWAPLEPRRSCPVEFYKGYALYRKQDYRKAKTIFLRSYDQHPHNQMITNNLGSVYGQLSKFDSAAYFFGRSMELLPRYELGLINLSKVYYLKENNEKAYHTILACDPVSKNPEINQIRSMLEGRLNNPQRD